MNRLETLTVKETAELIGINKDMLAYLIKQGKMPEIGRCIAYRRGKVNAKTFLIYRADVDRYIKEHSIE